MDEGILMSDIRARRKRLHTEAEQRRRDAIKRGYDRLLDLVCPVKGDPGASFIRMSKATILNKSVSTIVKLSRLEAQKHLELETLQKKLQTLKIVKSSYERVSNANTAASESSDAIITEQVKLQLFKLFIQDLFQSFDRAVSEVQLADLSQQIIEWMEDNCTPDLLNRSVEQLLKSVIDGDCSYPQQFGNAADSTLTGVNSNQQPQPVNATLSAYNHMPVKQMYDTQPDLFNSEAYCSEPAVNPLRPQQTVPRYANTDYVGRFQPEISKIAYSEVQNPGFSNSSFYPSTPMKVVPPSQSTKCPYQPIKEMSQDVVDPQMSSPELYSSRFSHPDGGSLPMIRESDNHSLVVNSTLPSHFQSPFQHPLAPSTLQQQQASSQQQHQLQSQHEDVVNRFSRGSQQYVQAPLGQPQLQHQQQQIHEQSSVEYAKKSPFFK